jgi:Uma2 family endonuclease
MVAKVLDIYLEERLIAERRALGLDKFDEVWDAEYVMSPVANDEHQRIVGFIHGVLTLLFQFPRLAEVRQGINLTNRPDDWTKNYRVPDVVLFFPNGQGVCHDTFWTGGPDFAVEVVSEGEDPEAKFEFYGGLNTRELLIVHRDPWRLEFYGPEPKGMRLLRAANVNQPGLVSSSVGLTFSLSGGEDDPELTLRHPDGRSWST